MRPESSRVLILTQYLHIGGLERMIVNLSTALKARGGWEPQVLVFDRVPEAGPENDLAPALVAAGIPVTAVQKPKGFSPRLVLTLRRTLLEGGIGVLHTHDLAPLIYGVCVKLLCLGRVRLVHTQHSFVYLATHWTHRHYHRFFARFADEIAVVSEDTRRSYIELGVPGEKIRVVPNGVRFPERARTPADAERARRELRDALDAPARAALEPFMGSRWLLHMSRVQRLKGQDHAVELWERLSPRARGECVLLFVGPEREPGTLARLRSRIERAPDSARVLYAGSTDRPDAWLTASDLALSCSEFEGMPLGPIEAAGAGLPLVLSRIPGHEVVRDWSSQYPLSDPDAGARQVEQILADLEAAPVDYPRRNWEKSEGLRARFTLSRMAADYERLYRA